VDDEAVVRDVLSRYLEEEGFRVETAADGESALDLAARSVPDVVVLDLMLPRIDGLEVLRRMRARRDVPVVLLTARGEEVDRIVGLEVGADDYVSKPYRLRELVARMRAVLRRSPHDRYADAAEGVLEVGDVRLDAERHEVTIRGEVVSMPLKEFELLTLLLANAGRVLTRDTLIDRVWGADYMGDTKTLDVHIKRLRAKVEDDPAHPTRIVTIRGLGYRYES
jgi:two-component system response regulator RegX3